MRNVLLPAFALLCAIPACGGAPAPAEEPVVVDLDTGLAVKPVETAKPVAVREKKDESERVAKKVPSKRLTKKELDRKIAENAGVLGALRDDGVLKGIFGSSGLDASLKGGIGGLIGAKGTQIGAGGLGSRGGGLGGGGTAAGIGGLGTMGRGSRGKRPARTAWLPTAQFNLSSPAASGPLPSKVVDRIVKRYQNQMRYCHERILFKKPKAFGGFTVAYEIAARGSVTKASVIKSTLNEPEVERCVVGRYLRMRFPKKKGVTKVQQHLEFLARPKPKKAQPKKAQPAKP